MDLKITIDDAILANKLERTTKNLVYTSIAALNDTAKAIQADGREDIRKHLHVRKESFTLNQVKITQFASVKKGVAFAEVGIIPKKRSFLTEFETGGERPNLTKGDKAPLIAQTGSKARLSMSDVSWLISSLKMKPYSVNPASLAAQESRARREKSRGPRSSHYDADGTFWRATKAGERAFLIPGIGVFERHGSGASDLDLLWSVQHKRIDLKPLLNFFEIAERDYASVFNLSFLRRLNGTWKGR